MLGQFTYDKWQKEALIAMPIINFSCKIIIIILDMFYERLDIISGFQCAVQNITMTFNIGEL